MSSALSRRGFLKGMTALGLTAAVPGPADARLRKPAPGWVSGKLTGAHALVEIAAIGAFILVERHGCGNIVFGNGAAECLARQLAQHLPCTPFFLGSLRGLANQDLFARRGAADILAGIDDARPLLHPQRLLTGGRP